MAVEVGFVEGITAATTPTGSAISRIPFSRSSRMIPVVFIPRIARATSTEANRFFKILSGTFPKPVSSTAVRASCSPAIVAASAQASTTASTCSWENAANFFCAWLARSTASRASWMEIRSRSRRFEAGKVKDRHLTGFQGSMPGKLRFTLLQANANSVAQAAAGARLLLCRARLTAPGQDFFHQLVRPRNYVHRHQLAYASRCCRARIGSSLHGAHVTSHHYGDEARANVLFADQNHVCGLHHRIRRFNRAHQPLRLDHPQRFIGHASSLTSATTFRGPCEKTKFDRSLTCPHMR